MLPRVLALVVLAVGLSACAGDGPSADTSSDWFSRLQRDVLDVNCLGAGCHNTQSQAGGLVLSEGFSYANLVTDGVPTNPAARAAGLQRVVPFDTGNSFLLIKLTEPGAGQGDRMPLGAPPLSADDLFVVTQWILNGAPPAQTPSVPIGASATPTATATPPPPTATPTAPGISPTATSTAPTPTGATPTAPSAPTATASPSATATQIVTLAQVQAQVFTPFCLNGPCHTSTFRAGDMVLEDGTSLAALVGVTPFNFAAREAGLVRVDPGNADESFLLIKLTGPSLPQGSLMPMGLPPLSAELIALVRNWIAQGAQP